jgi:phytoene dehydrogenase-like protein
MTDTVEAIVSWSGHHGLPAPAELARAGLSVGVLERNPPRPRATQEEP